MKLTVGNVLDVVAALNVSLKAHGVLDAKGDPVAVSIDVYAQVAQDVEQVLKADGVIVPEKVDVLVKLLPGILMAFGV